MRILVFALGAILIGCRSGPNRAPAIGEVFAGPATLALRQEINPRSAVITTVQHGERLAIIQQRRRFYKVRASSGAEGWADERNLLNPEEVGRLRQLSTEARNLPSQGVATTFEVLNVHTEANRYSPSFLQVKEGEKVDVLARSAAPRSAAPRKVLVSVAEPQPKKKKEAKSKASRVPPPAPPAAPKPPADWMELSKTTVPEPESRADGAQPPANDDWSLVRNQSGQAGWVLTRRLFMAIPDEVAQYAEGHRIRAYFQLGEVKDGRQTKPIWLWTTVGDGLAPYDFDSLRVFAWSTRRHRYETAYIERNLKGYLPVLLHSVAAPAKSKTTGAQTPGFSVLLKKKDGRKYRRSYALIDTRVRSAGEQAAETERREGGKADAPVIAEWRPAEPSAKAGGSVLERMRAWGERIFGR